MESWNWASDANFFNELNSRTNNVYLFLFCSATSLPTVSQAVKNTPLFVVNKNQRHQTFLSPCSFVTTETYNRRASHRSDPRTKVIIHADQRTRLPAYLHYVGPGAKQTYDVSQRFMRHISGLLADRTVETI